jgi:methionyl-tRNA formyltransferase
MASSQKIIFLGTPDFAVPSLEALVQAGYDVVAVVTAPDQPAGRGLQLHASPVKQCAMSHGIPVLQPEKLKNEAFLEQLASYKADLFIVVAFRMLPEVVWKMPPLGTFNLHASLLPQYRGAAPIHWAVMNGETETGLTTFFLKQEIDTGQILFQEKMPIGPEETTGELHDRMMIAGAKLLVKTADAIFSGQIHPTDQASLLHSSTLLKPAPKIFREDCRIDWHKSTQLIYNKVRGLNPVPTAWTNLVSPEGENLQLKIFNTSIFNESQGKGPGTIETDGKSHIFIITGDGTLALEELQLAGKRRMGVEEFLRGFRLTPLWRLS